ncbi:hypothetical protein Q8G48_28325, partial [Klebsiella pneumoniae]|uniref:hypothetical protein n=1 Tax=Klebsiella pneumoniae TaxID=573 RepID=UPI003013AFC1
LAAATAAALVFFVQGHGIHLAANAIGANSDPSERSWETSYFLDEHWGHVELHLAIIVLGLLFIFAARPNGPTSTGERVVLLLSLLTFGA